MKRSLLVLSALLAFGTTALFAQVSSPAPTTGTEGQATHAKAHPAKGKKQHRKHLHKRVKKKG